MRETQKSEPSRVRAKYLTASRPANDTGSPMVLMSVEQMLEAIDEAVKNAISEATPRLLDKAGLAARLSCSVSSVTRLLRKGCPHMKVGDSPRFIYENVIDWMATQQPKESA